MEESSFQRRQSFLTQMEPYLARHELREVLEAAQNRLRMMPDDLESRVVICRVRIMQGRLDEVRGMLGEIEEFLSALSGLYADLGDLYAKEGLSEEAETFYRKCGALNPEAPLLPERESHGDKLGVSASARPDEEESPVNEEYLDIAADFETVTMAELYLKQGHLSQAEDILRKIKARDPSNERADVLSNTIRILRAQRNQKQKNADIASILEKWLKNIESFHRHAV